MKLGLGLGLVFMAAGVASTAPPDSAVYVTLNDGRRVFLNDGRAVEMPLAQVQLFTGENLLLYDGRKVTIFFSTT